MKKTQATNKVTLASLITVAAVSLLFATEVSAKKFSIDLEVNPTQTVLEASSKGNCSDKNHKGCLQTTKHQSADIDFKLKGEKSCNKAVDAEWNLSQVYLGGKDSETKPGSWGNLDAEVVEDFDVADASSGLLNHDNGSNRQHIKISDENQYSYEIWYTVVANCVGPDGSVLGKLEVDPRLKNVGR